MGTRSTHQGTPEGEGAALAREPTLLPLLPLRPRGVPWGGGEGVPGWAHELIMREEVGTDDSSSPRHPTSSRCILSHLIIIHIIILMMIIIIIDVAFQDFHPLYPPRHSGGGRRRSRMKASPSASPSSPPSRSALGGRGGEAPVGPMGPTWGRRWELMTHHHHVNSYRRIASHLIST